MSNFEKPLPEWNAEGIKPPQSKRNEGWKEGDKPPAPWHNWWMNTTYMALDEIRKYLDELEIITKWEDIEEKPETFPPSTHTHDIKDVTGLQVKMNKLDGIEEGANKYTHPDTHQASMIVESTDKRFVSDAEKENWNSKETPEGAQEKVNEHANKTDNPHKVTKTHVGLGNVTNTKQASEANFNTHKDDGSAHGIGDKSTLETTEKSTIVGALNELFTNVSDGKQLIGRAITDADENVVIPTDATFEQLADAIGKAAGEMKKWAEGIKESTEDRILYVNDLDFKPRAIIWWADRYVGVLVDTNPFVYLRGENYYLGLVGYGSSIREFYKLSDAKIKEDGFEIKTYPTPNVPELNWIAFE